MAEHKVEINRVPKTVYVDEKHYTLVMSEREAGMLVELLGSWVGGRASIGDDSLATIYKALNNMQPKRVELERREPKSFYGNHIVLDVAGE